MSTRVFNLSLTSNPVPGPVFRWARDKEGKCTGSHTFTCLKGAMEMPINQARFKKGTSIIALDPSISSILSFLTLEDFEVQTIPGGYEQVSANFVGYSDGGDFEFDRETSYHSNNSLVEKSILENPTYLSEVTAEASREAFAKVYNGQATASYPPGATSSVAFKDPLGNIFLTLTDSDSLKWYRLIFVEDNRTYMAPTFEWVKTTANAGGLTSSELAALGKIDTPPGGPPEPASPGADYQWLKTGASDMRSENSATTEETWTFGKWPSDIYSS